MLQSIRKAFLLVLWMTFLLGVAYPLLVTLVAQFSMPFQANGSFFLDRKNAYRGSFLIGQGFNSNRYFWTRPSAIDYQPNPSGGSNLSITSKELGEQVDKRLKEIASRNGYSDTLSVPSELVYSSASGIDPHISHEATLFQLERVVKARKLSSAQIDLLKQKIEELTHFKLFSHLENAYVNVLSLNQFLDTLQDEHEPR